jgi:hypothetical protein
MARAIIIICIAALLILIAVVPASLSVESLKDDWVLLGAATAALAYVVCIYVSWQVILLVGAPPLAAVMIANLAAPPIVTFALGLTCSLVSVFGTVANRCTTNVFSTEDASRIKES